MLERVMRAMIPVEAVPRTTAGRMMCRNVPIPPDGSHMSLTETSSISSSPHQNTGIEMPKSERIVAA